MNFSKKIAELRDFFNLSNAGLEKKLSLSNGYISNIEKNGTDNPGKLLVALSSIGISTDWFLADKGNMFVEDTKQETLPFAYQNEQAKSKEPCLLLTKMSKQKAGKTADTTEKQACEDSFKSLVLESTAEIRERIDETFSEHNARLEKLEAAIRGYEVRRNSRQPDKAEDKAITYLEKVYSDDGGLIVAEPSALYGAGYADDTISLPLALNLAAGIPIEACDINETYRVPKKFLKKGHDYCVAKIKGTSMTDAGIADGAFVLLEYTDEPVSGTIMVVKYGNNTTLKRLHERADGIWELLYEDGSGAKIELQEGDWAVKGKMVRVV